MLSGVRLKPLIHLSGYPHLVHTLLAPAALRAYISLSAIPNFEKVRTLRDKPLRGKEKPS